jgi:hypothetical protein
LALLRGAIRLAPLAITIGRIWQLAAARALLQVVLPLLARLALRIARTGPVRVGAPQRALFAYDLTADGLRRMHLAHDALVARRLLR